MNSCLVRCLSGSKGNQKETHHVGSKQTTLSLLGCCWLLRKCFQLWVQVGKSELLPPKSSSAQRCTKYPLSSSSGIDSLSNQKRKIPTNIFLSNPKGKNTKQKKNIFLSNQKGETYHRNIFLSASGREKHKNPLQPADPRGRLRSAGLGLEPGVLQDAAHRRTLRGADLQHSSPRISRLRRIGVDPVGSDGVDGRAVGSDRIWFGAPSLVPEVLRCGSFFKLAGGF